MEGYSGSYVGGVFRKRVRLTTPPLSENFRICWKACRNGG